MLFGPFMFLYLLYNINSIVVMAEGFFCFLDFRAILSSWKRIEMMTSVITYLLLPPGNCVHPQYHLVI